MDGHQKSNPNSEMWETDPVETLQLIVGSSPQLASLILQESDVGRTLRAILCSNPSVARKMVDSPSEVLAWVEKRKQQVSEEGRTQGQTQLGTSHPKTQKQSFSTNNAKTATLSSPGKKKDLSEVLQILRSARSQSFALSMMEKQRQEDEERDGPPTSITTVQAKMSSLSQFSMLDDDSGTQTSKPSLTSSDNSKSTGDLPEKKKGRRILGRLFSRKHKARPTKETKEPEMGKLPPRPRLHPPSDAPSVLHRTPWDVGSEYRDDSSQELQQMFLDHLVSTAASRSRMHPQMLPDGIPPTAAAAACSSQQYQ